VRASDGKRLWGPVTGGFAETIVANGVVYQAADQALLALDAVSGALLWQTNDFFYSRSPIVADGVVYWNGSYSKIEAFAIP
jgi:outer membrane protein assembly factor BamB